MLFRIHVSIILSLLALAMSAPAGSAEVMKFSKHMPQNYSDHRPNYTNLLLELALEKTKTDYGPYELVATPPMSRSREIDVLRKGKYPNYFVASVVDARINNEPDITYVNFPIILGILGYRVCFYPKDKKNKISGYVERDEVPKALHGQGWHWPDIDIMKHNGFLVEEVRNFESLFRMIIAGRLDFFCRGIGEVLVEFEKRKHFDNLAVDDSFVLYYDYPMFFFTNKNNVDAIRRVTEGLKRAYEDGSLLQLWTEYYGEGIFFSELGKRKVIQLENPLMHGVPNDYTPYIYRPGQALPSPTK